MISLFKRFTLAALIILLVASLAGCSSSLKPNQEAEVGPYIIVLSQACESSNEMNELSAENKKMACDKIAVKTLTSSREYLIRFKYEYMQNECKQKSGAELSTCLMEYQKNFYQGRVAGLFDNTYK
jgi:outer membrane murein-binding lipoprotein Lpp